MKEKESCLKKIHRRMGKKHIVIVTLILTLVLLSFAGFILSNKVGLFQKSYYTIDGTYEIVGEEDLGFLSTLITFNLEEHTCMLPQSIVSSVYPGGTFQIKDNMIITKGVGGQNTYLFKIINEETIMFVQEGSSEISTGDGGTLPDGTLFKKLEE